VALNGKRESSLEENSVPSFAAQFMESDIDGEDANMVDGRWSKGLETVRGQTQA
jgi:hypothetical protein